MPFDREHPPIDPPAGCLHPLTWSLAVALDETHRPGVDGFCGQCRMLDPCPGRGLARYGLFSAMGIATHGTMYWVGLTQIRQRDLTGAAIRTDRGRQ